MANGAENGTWDTGTSILPELDWADIPASLRKIRQHVEKKSEKASAYYRKARRRKKTLAVALRLGAVLFTVAAGLIPIFAVIWDSASFSALATVFLGLAGGLISIDKLLGHSTGWIRFITAEMTIQARAAQFAFDWEAALACDEITSIDCARAKGLFEIARVFDADTDKAVRNETDEWIAEFQSSLRQLETQVKSQMEKADEQRKQDAAARQKGGINLTVQNYERLASWKLQVDGGQQQQQAGATASIRELEPGPRTLRVTGSEGGVERAFEKTFIVVAGQFLDESVTLE